MKVSIIGAAGTVGSCAAFKIATEGLASMVAAISGDTGQVIPCSVVLDGEYSCQGLSLGVPAMLGKGGVKQIMNWELPPDEQSELEYCKNVLKAATQVVDAVLR